MPSRPGRHRIDMIWLTIIGDFLKKAKDFVVEYWKAFVALILVLVGYILGTRGDTSKVDRADKKSLEDHNKRMIDGQKDLYEKRIKEIEAAADEHEKQVAEIKKKTERDIKDLSNDPEKLDKILKEKYNLKKGE